jgi:hypothetical protein
MPRPPREKPHKEKLVLVPSAQDIAAEVIPAKETTLDRVLRENGVTAKTIAQQPRMTKALEYMGGLDVAAEYMRGSEDPDAMKFMEVYDRVYDDRDFLEFEGICAAAGVSGKKLFGIIVSEATVESEQKMALLTAIKTPDVIDYTMELAKAPQGYRERLLVAKASGWLPRPKGSQTNIQINTANMGSKGGTNTTLPPFDQDIRELNERFQQMNADRSPKLIEGKV